MTTLAEVFALLSTGELSQVHLGNSGNGIQPNDQEKLLGHINLGLAALYKRFTIRKGELVLELIPGKTVYDLTLASSEAHARKGWDGATPEPDWNLYPIKDVANPFLADINKIEAVYTEEGKLLYLNDSFQRYSLETLSQTKLKVPAEIANYSLALPADYRTHHLIVKYRSKYIPVVKEKCNPGAYFEPSQIELEIPDMYLEALIYFVASRVMNPIGLNQEFYAGDNYAAKYEAECQRLEQYGLQLTEDNTNVRFRRNGFI